MILRGRIMISASYEHDLVPRMVLIHASERFPTSGVLFSTVVVFPMHVHVARAYPPMIFDVNPGFF